MHQNIFPILKCESKAHAFVFLVYVDSGTTANADHHFTGAGKFPGSSLW